MNVQWNKVTINDVAQVRSGKRLPKGEILIEDNTGHPYIRARDIKNGKITFNDPKYITNDVFEKIKRYTVEQGDVCLTIVANIGDVGQVPYYLDGANLTENAVKLVEIIDQCDPKFLKYSLSAPHNKKQMELSAAGAAQSKLGIYKVKAVEFDLPKSVATQRKIAGVLSAYDDLIENNTRRIAILEEMAQRIYKEWFVDFKYPGHENDKLVDSELGMIPEGWKVKEFGEKITFARGKNITKKQMIHGEVPVVSAGINPSGFHNTSNVNAPVVTISASGANAGYISYYLRNIWAADCSYINNDMTPYIFYYFSLVKFYSKEITNLQRGAAQPHVYPKDVARISIIDPKIETIIEFDNIVSDMFNEIGILRKKISNLQKTRDHLLPKLISGQVDVSDLNIDTGADA